MNTTKSKFFLIHSKIFGVFFHLLKSWNHFFPPFFNEDSSLKRLLFHYPNASEWFLHRYGLNSQDLRPFLHRSLRDLTKNHALPPPQLLFLEIQMSSRWNGVEFLDPREVKSRLDATSSVQILDVRDDWELKVAKIAGAELLDERKLESLARSTERSSPVLLYCHFGVRSADFAVRLKEWGYENVWILRGGIDAWSQIVDPSVPRYEGSWC